MLACATLVLAQPASVMPAAIQQFFDSSGNPLSGGTLTFYAAGTTTPQTAYSDSSLVTPLANPLTLDSGGRTSTPVYLSGVLSYKILLKNSAGTTIWTADNQAGAQYLATQAVQPQVQTTTSTGTQNDFALTCGSVPVCVLRANNGSDTTFTGFTPGVSGERLIVLSVGAGNVFFASQSGSSTAAYRLMPFVTGTTTPLAAGVGSAEFVYDSTTTRWRMVRHDQGAAISYTPTITASSGTFTSVSATGSYRFIDRQCWIRVTITVTTNGTAAGLTNFTLPTTSSSTVPSVMPVVEVSSTGYSGGAYVAVASTTGAIRKYDGTYLGANGYVILTSGAYEVP